MPSTPPTQPHRLITPLLFSLLAWHAIYFPLAAFTVDLPCTLTRGLLWLTACALVITTLFALRKSRTPARTIALLALLLCLPAQWIWSRELALHARFAIIHSKLTADIASIRAGTPTAHWSGPCKPEGDPQSPASPIAFIDGGMGDNWAGFIFDPNSAQSPTPPTALSTAAHKSPVPAPFSNWFGGNMTHAIPLGNGWFYCWFT